MPSATAPGVTPGVPGRGAVHSAWAELENHLKNARRSVFEQIRNYPPPITACDQQFNYLLEESDRLSGELSRLATVRRDYATGETDIEALVEFINASACIDNELKARLTAELNRRSGATP